MVRCSGMSIVQRVRSVEALEPIGRYRPDAVVRQGSINTCFRLTAAAQARALNGGVGWKQSFAPTGTRPQAVLAFAPQSAPQSRHSAHGPKTRPDGRKTHSRSTGRDRCPLLCGPLCWWPDCDGRTRRSQESMAGDKLIFCVSGFAIRQSRSCRCRCLDACPRVTRLREKQQVGGRTSRGSSACSGSARWACLSVRAAQWRPRLGCCARGAPPGLRRGSCRPLPYRRDCSSTQWS